MSDVVMLRWILQAEIDSGVPDFCAPSPGNLVDPLLPAIWSAFRRGLVVAGKTIGKLQGIVQSCDADTLVFTSSKLFVVDTGGGWIDHVETLTLPMRIVSSISSPVSA